MWLPLLLLVILWIKTSSAGPAFFRQHRVGYLGEPFFIFKCRTMKVNADTRVHEDYFQQLIESDRPMTKLDGAGDSRLIPGGAILRASGLDELPQIFNVLRGDMSVVGPRPCTVKEFERYDERQKKRHQTLPGLTGYWQTHGKNKTTFAGMIEMDLFYVRNASLALDLRIIARTVPTLISQVMDLLQIRSARTSGQQVLQRVAVRKPKRN